MKASNVISLFRESCSYSPYQSFRCAKFAFFNVQGLCTDHDLLVAFRFYLDKVVVCSGSNGYNVKVYRCRKHLAMLMVCMITADLAAARSAVNLNFFIIKNRAEAFKCMYIPFPLVGNYTLIGIYVQQQPVIFTGFKPLNKIRCILSHRYFLPYDVPVKSTWKIIP